MECDSVKICAGFTDSFCRTSSTSPSCRGATVSQGTFPFRSQEACFTIDIINPISSDLASPPTQPKSTHPAWHACHGGHGTRDPCNTHETAKDDWSPCAACDLFAITHPRGHRLRAICPSHRPRLHIRTRGLRVQPNGTVVTCFIQDKPHYFKAPSPSCRPLRGSALSVRKCQGPLRRKRA